MIIGSGYIAVELAGIFKALGTEVVLSIRYDKVGEEQYRYCCVIM